MTHKIDVNGKAMEPSELADLISEAQGWRPEDGDSIEGTVLGMKIAWSEIGEREYPIVFVLPKGSSEAIAVHGFQSILFSEFRSQRPERGDSIYVKRTGTAEPTRKGQSGAVKYSVLVSKPGSDTSSPWDAFGSPRKPTKRRTDTDSWEDVEPPF